MPLWRVQSHRRRDRRRRAQDEASVAMQNFAYVRAGSVAEALHVVANGNRERTRFLAGGTTLVDLMKLDVMHAQQLIDITSISELQRSRRRARRSWFSE